MQEPIREGESFLNVFTDGVKEAVRITPILVSFHPYELRLPDRFQKRDEVEEKIQHILNDGKCTEYDAHVVWPEKDMKQELHELVELARKEVPHGTTRA